MLSPRFIPESVFYTHSVVRCPQSVFYSDRMIKSFVRRLPFLQFPVFPTTILAPVKFNVPLLAISGVGHLLTIIFGLIKLLLFIVIVVVKKREPNFVGRSSTSVDRMTRIYN